MDEQNQPSMDRRSLLARGGAVAAGAIGATVAGVATAAPALAAGLGYTPINPFRSYDSRNDTNGKMPAGDVLTLSLLTDEMNNVKVPAAAQAQAVTFNLTITQTESAGYLGVVPAGTNDFSVSNINWVVPKLDVANGGTTKIAVDGQAGPGSVQVFCNGEASAKTHFIIDVTGYFS